MKEDHLQVLFDQVVDLPPGARQAFLAQTCEGDPALRAEIEDLLAADDHASAETFWQHSAIRNQVIADGAASNAIGETIGQYRLVSLLGKGGMGAVYRAERIDAAFNKSVAIKLINGVFHSADVIQHFRAERQILANLEHPNIARLLDGGARPDGLPYLIMEFVDGIPPYDYAHQHNLSTTQRLVLFRQICAAVHFAHQHMVIHRDLKPANILVTADGTPKLLDFGIAKVLNQDPLLSADHLTAQLTEPGMLKLTARYASPEQVRGEVVTTASDVYSLGVILYELLCGHSPYGDADRAPHQLMSAVCDEDPPRPSHYAPALQRDLDNIVLLALKKSPRERYASVDQFSEDILRYLDGRPVQAHSDAPLYIAAKFVRRNWVFVTGALVLLFALIGGLIEVTLERARADRRFNDVRRLAHSVMFDYADAIDRLPGATPVRAKLVSDALTYLDSLSKEADTPQLQREIVDAYVRVSNVQGNEYQNNLGNTADALSSAQKAVAEAEKLLKRDQTLPALDSAASAFSTNGSLLYSSGDLPAADRAYQRAVDLRRHIAQKTPDDIANQIALATCLSHLGDLYGGYGFQNLGRTSESLAWYAQAKAIAEDLTTRYPDNLDVAKERYEMLLPVSASENASGKHAEAAADLTAALAQIEKVRLAQPHDTNVTAELANAESRLGQLLIDARQFAAATPHLARSAGLLQDLLSADPKNTLFRRGVSIVDAQWAAALRGAGQPAEGVALNENGLRLAQALSHDAPSSAQFKIDVGVSERKLSECLLANNNPAAALEHAQQATQILCRTETTAANPTTLANCGRSQLATANAYLALHNPSAAQAAAQKSATIARAQVQADPKNAIARSDAARAQATLAGAQAQAGDIEAARLTYGEALESWSQLSDMSAITAEDAQRAALAERARAALHR